MKQLPLETKVKEIIEVDGLKFKDLNGNGKLDPYEDWRLSPRERAEDLVSQMTIDEKVGMMVISTLYMGKALQAPNHDDNQVLVTNKIDAEYTKFRKEALPTQEYIEKMHIRHFIQRDARPVADNVEWMNALNEMAEGTRLGIPVIVTSNSKNENSDAHINGNPYEGAYSIYPGTLGIAAATKGDLKRGGDYSLVEQFAENSRQEWVANGIRKGYMYMADVMTDPRWQRTFGTFGEDPEFIAETISRLIEGFQGEDLNNESIGLTIKHFPGGGARENGFDPHYAEGKWNVYRTPGSLENYHLPPFVAAAKKQPSSMMPYYSAPSIDKSSYQTYDGKLIPFEEVGMAFNQYILNDLLRDQLGFEGYINSDSGITGDMAWGMEDKEVPVRFAKAVNAGTDMIADTYDTENLRKAYDQGLIPESRLDEANINLLLEMFKLGLFDDQTYVNPERGLEIAEEKERKEAAYEAHLKSVTLLKDDGTLPLEGQKVYIEAFHKDLEKADQYTKNSIKAAQDLMIDLVDDYREADVAILFVRPETGDYFNATPGLLELEICENKTNIAMNGDTYQETTISNLGRYDEITDYMKAQDKKVVTALNITMPWIVSHVEERSNVLVAGYDTFEKAILEVLIGNFEAQGVLPITLPKNEAVIGVDEHGICVSRNDVPGYDKDKYLRPGMTYAYEDAAGNEYKLNFGL